MVAHFVKITLFLNLNIYQSNLRIILLFRKNNFVYYSEYLSHRLSIILTMYKKFISV